MENLKAKVDEFNALVQEFKLVEAVDKFYDNNIVSHENEDEPVKGLKNYREAVVKFQEAVGKGAGTLKNVLVSGGRMALYFQSSRIWSNGLPAGIGTTLEKWKNHSRKAPL